MRICNPLIAVALVAASTVLVAAESAAQAARSTPASPLPSKGTVLQKQQPPVLATPPSPPATGTVRTDTPLQQSPLAGSVSGSGNAAADLRVNDIICRGGNQFATAHVSTAAPAPTGGTQAAIETHIMYFYPSSGPAGRDGAGLKPGRCGYLDQPWPNPSAQILELTAAAGNGPGSHKELMDYFTSDSHFWSFRVHKDQRGYYVSTERTKWAPVRQPQPGDSIQGQSTTLGEDVQVDCVRNPPRIAHVRGAITPGRPFTIAGMCFGDRPGHIEMIGQFAGGTLRPPFSAWHEDQVIVEMPATAPVATLSSHKIAVTVIRAPDGKKSAALPADFRGELLRVRVPDNLWTPAAHFAKEELAENNVGIGIGRTPFSSAGYDEKTFSGTFRVAVNAGCSLDNVEVPATKGRVVSIDGWNGPIAHQDEVTVTWTRQCRDERENYVVAGVTNVVCNVDFELQAWAMCPRGVSVNP